MITNFRILGLGVTVFPVNTIGNVQRNAEIMQGSKGLARKSLTL